MSSPNRQFKASFFSSVFRTPEKRRELFFALNLKTDIPPDAKIIDATLDDVLFLDRINDLAFLIGNVLIVLVEHQSTINKNMPLRFLIYIARVYEKIINNKTLYRRELQKIPAPEFVVLYNGNEDLPAKKTLKLSDAFQKVENIAPSMELEVTVYNINKGSELAGRSPTLDGYIYFVDGVKTRIATGENLEDAIKRTTEDCISQGILADYLESNASEVINMLTQEWDWDTFIEINSEEQYNRGVERGRTEIIQQLLSMGMLSEEQKQKLQL